MLSGRHTPDRRPAWRAIAITGLATLLIGTSLGCWSSSSSYKDGPYTGSVRVFNDSFDTVFYLYIAPCSDTTWGDDQLGADIIAPGGRHTVFDIPPGCYDLRAETRDGEFWEFFSVFLSSGERFTWTLNP
jgi:hypothetical protein